MPFFMHALRKMLPPSVSVLPEHLHRTLYWLWSLVNCAALGQCTGHGTILDPGSWTPLLGCVQSGTMSHVPKCTRAWTTLQMHPCGRDGWMGGAGLSTPAGVHMGGGGGEGVPLRVNIWCQHLVSTFGVNIWCQHLVSTFGVNIWCQHLVSTFGVNICGGGKARQQAIVLDSVRTFE